jgi:hypothetical protein
VFRADNSIISIIQSFMPNNLHTQMSLASAAASFALHHSWASARSLRETTWRPWVRMAVEHSLLRVTSQKLATDADRLKSVTATARVHAGHLRCSCRRPTTGWATRSWLRNCPRRPARSTAEEAAADCGHPLRSCGGRFDVVALRRRCRPSQWLLWRR